MLVQLITSKKSNTILHNSIKYNNGECPGNNGCSNPETCAEMLPNYIDAKSLVNVSFTGESNQQGNRKTDINELLNFKDIWTNEEKARLAQLIEENNYDGIGSLLVDKCAELNETKIDLNKKIAAYDTNMQSFKELLAEEAEVEISRLRALYGIMIKNLPKGKMTFVEQMAYVGNILIENKNKLTNMDENTVIRITEAMLDNEEKLTNDGLKFLSKLLNVSKQRTEEEVLEAIGAVKDDNGSIDLEKSAGLIVLVAIGEGTFRSLINKVKNGSLQTVKHIGK